MDLKLTELSYFSAILISFMVTYLWQPPGRLGVVKYMDSLILKLKPLIHLDSDSFYKICLNNPDAKLELSEKGELIILSPTGGESSERNSSINAQLWNWNELTKLGKVFDSNGGFTLPSGAVRSPDASWILLQRWKALRQEQRETFVPLAPDFVVELRSKSDSLKSLQDKMLEYMSNGVRLGWLIDPQNQRVEIYRQGQEKEVLHNPTQLSGEDVLPGLIFDCQKIYE